MCVAIEVNRDHYNAVLCSLETLEAAGVDIVGLRLHLRYSSVFDDAAGELVGPLFPIYGRDGVGPLKYVFYVRVPYAAGLRPNAAAG